MSNFTYDKLAVLVPLHENTEDNITLLKRSLSSIPTDVEVMVVVPKSQFQPSFTKQVEGMRKLSSVHYSNQEATDFCTLVNEGLKAVENLQKFEYVSILEIDDTYNSEIFSKNVAKYINNFCEYDVLLPLTYLINITDDMFSGFQNESALGVAFGEKFGDIPFETLKDYFVFNFTGAVFKFDIFKKYGYLKPSVQIYFWYEWALRLTNKGVKMRSVPKVWYNHFINRSGSLVSQVSTISEEERNYWLSVAQKNYTNDNMEVKFEYKSKA